MPARFVGNDRPYRIWFGPRGATVVIQNNDAANDAFVSASEEALLNNVIPGTAPPTGIKTVHAGGGINWVNVPEALYARGAVNLFLDIQP
jgi:hypothetical protein